MKHNNRVSKEEFKVKLLERGQERQQALDKMMQKATGEEAKRLESVAALHRYKLDELIQARMAQLE